MTMPNFLVIGAAKSGTTSMYHYLSQHPEIYMSPVKEPHFFAFEGEGVQFPSPGSKGGINLKSVSDEGAYRTLFGGVSGEKAAGEASTSYLYYPEAAGRIKRHVPEAKLIAVLRDPAERAYSTFLALTLIGREPLREFSRALEAEEERIEAGWEHIWHYKNVGFYHAQISRYFELFGRNRVQVHLYEDLHTNPLGVMRDIFGFLGVDEAFAPDASFKHNISGVPKNRFLSRMLRQRHPLKDVLKPFFPKALRQRLVSGLQRRVIVRPPFPQEERRRLVEAYTQDIRELEGLIGRDLSGWLESSPAAKVGG
ncbi:MAG: sulfotransferase [Actinobacteria bacterium]|nr:MAG: sulfotransferase [Actinomycetota bacterium]